MNLQSDEERDTQECEGNGALTSKSDWTRYYLDREIEQIGRAARETSIIDDYLKNNPGKIFELGCGGSHILARSAMLGWEVGGIDFNANALALLQDFLCEGGYRNSNLICGDIFLHDSSQLSNKYDLLVSFGFLEHFHNPQSILSKWKAILKRDGVVISVIPNLFSVNAAIFKKFDPDFWAQHISYSPDDMDRFHSSAGLVPLERAQYCGRYDIHMLIPWDRIGQSIGNKYLFKTIKYLAYYGPGKILGLLPKANVKKFNSFVIGVYKRQPIEKG